MELFISVEKSKEKDAFPNSVIFYDFLSSNELNCSNALNSLHQNLRHEKMHRFNCCHRVCAIIVNAKVNLICTAACGRIVTGKHPAPIILLMNEYECNTEAVICFGQEVMSQDAIEDV